MDQKHRIWLVLVCGILLGALLLPMQANAETVSRQATGVTSVRSEGELQLGERNKQVYKALKTAVCKIAAGEQTSTQVQLSSGLGLDIWTTTAQNQALRDEISYTCANTIDKIVRYLLVDCPYEMYWYDKVNGCQYTYKYTVDYAEDGTQSVTVYGLTVSFAVAQDYAGKRNYTTNPDKIRAAAAVTAYAKEIVKANRDKCDCEKLLAYKEAVCSLVSYAADAASGNYAGGYGAPWQMIYVFDCDPATNVVCEGYAKAFQYLCDMTEFADANFVCRIVEGTLNDGNGSQTHMWNSVTLHGQNYLVDLTNCDSGTIGENGELFLAGAVQSGTSGKYSITVEGITLTYQCSTGTLAMYDTKALTLAAQNYPYSDHTILQQASQ
jgi:hypothetical protein